MPPLLSVTADEKLMYTTPACRDSSVGQFLMKQLADKGVKELHYSGPAEHHKVYLKKLGYRDRDGVYVRRL